MDQRGCEVDAVTGHVQLMAPLYKPQAGYNWSYLVLTITFRPVRREKPAGGVLRHNSVLEVEAGTSTVDVNLHLRETSLSLFSLRCHGENVPTRRVRVLSGTSIYPFVHM